MKVEGEPRRELWFSKRGGTFLVRETKDTPVSLYFPNDSPHRSVAAALEVTHQEKVRPGEARFVARRAYPCKRLAPEQLDQRTITIGNILWSNTKTDENIDKIFQGKLIGMKCCSVDHLFSSELQLKELSLLYLTKS